MGGVIFMHCWTPWRGVEGEWWDEQFQKVLIFQKTIFSHEKKGLGFLIIKKHDQLNSLLLTPSFPELKFWHNDLEVSGE